MRKFLIYLLCLGGVGYIAGCERSRFIVPVDPLPADTLAISLVLVPHFSRQYLLFHTVEDPLSQNTRAVGGATAMLNGHPFTEQIADTVYPLGFGSVFSVWQTYNYVYDQPVHYGKTYRLSVHYKDWEAEGVTTVPDSIADIFYVREKTIAWPKIKGAHHYIVQIRSPDGQLVLYSQGTPDTALTITYADIRRNVKYWVGISAYDINLTRALVAGVASSGLSKGRPGVFGSASVRWKKMVLWEKKASI